MFGSVVPAVRTAPIEPPRYAAALPYDDEFRSAGMVVRAGDAVRRTRGGQEAVWLNDGRLLTTAETHRRGCHLTSDPYASCAALAPVVLDPSTGRTTRVPEIDELAFEELPGDALHRVTLLASVTTADAPVDRLVGFRADVTDPHVLELPDYDGDNSGISRNTGHRVFSVGAWDFVSYSDNDGEDASESYGYLRREVGSDTWEKVLVGQRLVALWVSTDGRALLGLQQQRGEPCGGCSVAQQIVEIDPRSGTIAGSYGVPEEYDKSWRVGQIDKEGDRILVRYVLRHDLIENLGVWQYDGSWSRVAGTTGPFTWWQGPEDRIEAAAPDPLPETDSYSYRFTWVHGGVRTPLPGVVLKDYIEGYRGVPGSLVPPS